MFCCKSRLIPDWRWRSRWLRWSFLLDGFWWLCWQILFGGHRLGLLCGFPNTIAVLCPILRFLSFCVFPLLNFAVQPETRSIRIVVGIASLPFPWFDQPVLDSFSLRCFSGCPCDQSLLPLGYDTVLRRSTWALSFGWYYKRINIWYWF